MKQTQQPGMVARQRHCIDCGVELRGDYARCDACRPQLSTLAQEIATQRQEARERIAALEREAEGLQTAIRQVDRRMRWRQRHG